MIPALDIDEDVDYHFYVGERIKTIGFWKRTAKCEFPIYQQTRGQAVWNSTDPSFGNIGEREPTDAFWNALTQIVDEKERIDVRDCEWYEREMINKLMQIAAAEGDDSLPMEVGQLFKIAEEREVSGE